MMSRLNRFELWSQIKTLLSVAVPLSLGMMSQNLMTIIDSLMVAKLGHIALAAIGLGGFLIFVVNAATVGFSTFVQRVTSVVLGAGDLEKLSTSLSLALVICILLLPLYSFLIYQLSPGIVNNMHDNSHVIDQLFLYVDIRLLAVVLVGISFAFRGYYSALNIMKYYLAVMLLMQLLNIFLNYILIFGNFGLPAMGIQGAAFASLFSTLVATVTYWIIATRKNLWKFSFDLNHYKEHIQGLFKVLIPYGMQQIVFVAGFAVFLWIVGMQDAERLAVAGVILNVSLFFYLPAIGFGIAAAGKVSYEIGAGNFAQIRYWVNLALVLVFMIFSLISIPLLLFTKEFLAYFFISSDTLMLALEPMKIAALVFAIEAMGIVLMQALFASNRGVSASFLSSVTQWLLFLPIVYWQVVYMQASLTMVWITLAIYRVLNVIMLFVLWRKEELPFQLQSINPN